MRTHAPIHANHHGWTRKDLVDTIQPFLLGFGLAAVPLGVFVMWLVS